ncbi:MAG: MFS transporter [Chloroflexi bacterium]|nr:MAG: MFS transporter [Chloroflexota bacterium]TME47441.1 MAG: MFS transporter [Chloroflexota bacterium]
MLRGRLWRHPDFLKLWAGETVSEFGSQVTLLAVPTVAILVLHAGPFQVGILSALEFLAFPTLGLVAGVYADRIKRRPIMIACDIGRLLALGSIPIAFTLNALTLGQLYVVALLTGIFNVFFDVSYQSYLPALVERTNLIEGNTKLEVTRSGSQIAGPAVAGFLIQLIGGARAVAVDAISFLASALALAVIRKPEPNPNPGTASGRSGFFAEMREGIEVVFKNPYLWRIAGCTATTNLGSNMVFGAVFLIFAYRDLHLSAAVVGIVFGISSGGWLVGAFLASWAARSLGLGLTLALAILLGGLITLATPLALLGAPVVVLAVLGFLNNLTVPIYNINQVSLRQAITPDRVQGRMNATMRTIVWGTIPFGAFVGGILGTAIGVVQTIVVGSLISVFAALWLLLGPVVALKEQPAPVGA